MKRNRSTQWILPLAIWLISSLISIATVAAIEYRAGLAELSALARQTDTLLAEKLAQHDAHMTALAAVIRMSPTEPSPTIQGLANSITAFYPRIDDIATIHVDGPTAHVVTYGKPTGPTVAEYPAGAELPGFNKPGETAIRAIVGKNAYDIYKLVESNRLLRLRINASALLPADEISPGYFVGLSLDDIKLFTSGANEASRLSAATSLSASNPGQPLHLTLGRRFSLGELMPPRLIAPLMLGLAALVWLVVGYRNARQERHRQERRAALLEQEARLAHAGRVNALGEMASGIAHELAQPVAALLSQSQAARRALVIQDNDILLQALDANVREAKRAGDILGRMRAYISGAKARIEMVALADALTDAVRLVEADLVQRSIALNIAISDRSCMVAIDVISFQQVIHNLIRNAVEALFGRPEPRINLWTGSEGQDVIIAVADNGPGIDVAALDRIFEPFFTTKPDGMGLGLPLCARLIEKMNGTIEARNDDGGCFIIRLPSGGAQ